MGCVGPEEKNWIQLNQGRSQWRSFCENWWIFWFQKINRIISQFLCNKTFQRNICFVTWKPLLVIKKWQYNMLRILIWWSRCSRWAQRVRLSVVFFSFSRQIPTYCLKSDYDRILLHPFQFITIIWRYIVWFTDRNFK